MIFSISDLHLSSNLNKPMDIFGENWLNHQEKIADDWIKKVSKDDIVLLPGDLSWGLKLEEALPDLGFIDNLPGSKIIIKGNHDYWWTSYKKLVDLPLKSLNFIQNNSISFGDTSYCGTRGWAFSGDMDLTAADEKIYKRELLRLEMSLQFAENKRIVTLLHYPPFGKTGEKSEIVDLLEKYQVEKCVYGHIHNSFHSRSFIDGIYNNIEYKLVSCDYLDFKLYQLY